jgi:subfamily B ATP-binding cassette protein MsbA
VINNFNNLLTAISVFLLIYFAISFANISLGALGVFLFAMFRLGPKVSFSTRTSTRLRTTPIPCSNKGVHRRTRAKPRAKRRDQVCTGGDPDSHVDDVSFSYQGQDEQALSGISLEFDEGEFVGFVRQSGAGKSTAVSLLA